MNMRALRIRAVACLVGLIVAVVTAVTASAQTTSSQTILYGTTSGGDASLYTINPPKRVGTWVGSLRIPTSALPPNETLSNGGGVGALAEDPTTGILYGVMAPGFIPPSGTTRQLVTIDKRTGTATLVGPLGATGFRFGIAEITFRSDGTLFGWSENSDDLVRINKSTGAATIVADAGISTFGSGMKFDANGILYLAGGGGNGAFRTVDPTSGLTTLLGILTGCPFPGFPIPAMAIQPGTNTIYAVNRTFPPLATGTLITINPTTLACTSIGPTVPRLDGLAFGSPPLGPPYGPTISGIPDQTLPMNSTVSVPYTIGGDLLPTALRVTLASSNPTLLPVGPTTLTSSCDLTGACTLRITPEDGRVGSSTVTVNVFDLISTVSTSFNVTVTGPGGRPTAPGVALANAVGSGISVTWTAPDTGMPAYYAVAWGTSTGASNLPLQLVPGSVGRLDIAGVPSGTYFFRVYAIGGDVSAPSRETSVVVASSASVPGPPTGLQAISGAGTLTTGWNAPFIGGAPTLYEVQVSTAIGANDVADVTTGSTLLTRTVSAGNYWVQARGSAGGANGAFSTAVQIPVSPAACSAAPAAPVLLPVTTTPGQMAFNWVTTGPAASYQVQIFQGATPLTTVNSAGAGTSAVWTVSGAGAVSARVTATNACGTSGPSNLVNFTVP